MNLFLFKKTNDSISESLKNTKLRIWLVLFIGIIIILVTLIHPKICLFGNNISPFLQNLGKSFFAAATIALILRVPTLLNDVNNSSIKLFKDNKFLKRLDTAELKTLRADATESAYSRSANSVNISLKEIDTQIANLFLQPYYSSFKIIVRCRFIENNLIEKKITTTYTLKNPNKEKCNAFDHLKSRVILKKIDGFEDNKLREILKFQVIKDNKGNWENILNYFGLSHTNYEEESSPYNVLTNIKPKKGANTQLEFENNIQIKVTEKRIVSRDDNTYLYRVVGPVEKFSINYSFEECDVDLIGNCFGTFQDTKNGGINIVKDKNSINISTEKWLLNGNGIIVVHNYNKS